MQKRQHFCAALASLLVLALLRSAGCCVSAMEMSTLISATLDLLVLETTDREAFVLFDVGLVVRTVFAEVRIHVVCAVAIVFSRTPEVCVVALAAIVPIVVPVAGRKRRKTKGVIAVASITIVVILAVCRF